MKQSFAWWCFRDRGVDDEALLRGAAKIGFAGVELIDEELWPLARKAGLRISAMAGHGTLTDGLNRRENAARIEAELLANIAKAEAERVPVLICFSGNRGPGVDDASGLDAAAETLGRVAARAEAAGVTLAVELLNSRVDHPDYMADRTTWGVALCERVNSPAVRLLYDVYHMQIMEGDVMRTIAANHRWFAHYHTAGNPGRGEFVAVADDAGGDPLAGQELNYRAIFREIKRTGFAGYIGHEFVPAGDPLATLARAHALAVSA